MTDVTARSRPATPACGPRPDAEPASFPPEQMRLYGYDAEAVLREDAATI